MEAGLDPDAELRVVFHSLLCTSDNCLQSSYPRDNLFLPLDIGDFLPVTILPDSLTPVIYPLWIV